ncbi:MAG TPA: ribonuclease P protein component [Gammaproteobacteria bacterium]
MSRIAGQVEVTERAREDFGRDLRLLKPAEFKQVFDGSAKVVTRYLTLLARANTLGYPRLGMAISRKNVRSAVKRNQIKRQVRESFRLNQSELGGIDVVVMARGGIRDWEWRELRAGLDGKWQELVKRCKSC